MPIALNLKEKCYLVALFGDIPEHRQTGLFAVSSLPAQAGPAVIAAGYDFVDRLKGKSSDLKRIRRRRVRAPFFAN